MTTTTALTVNDITRASLDERWLGFGYLGERHNRIRLVEQELVGVAADTLLMLIEATDQRVAEAVRHHLDPRVIAD